ncbi:LacI family DNA-binding transcriptional regulator [Limoniibacter endophyticus]|uniref:LacI family transcriptional regulator n=1 Tax=Limoniibacter endophyticus TaxID=1565040 RepID=A0A8J3GH89_9HYPH|nr:LacI family DNA-binding transcriptional regulator [Limoniibacter endophyticus]GHC73180.1 LacI family transcriptional regulator [Limoniibacter endophyticus]
MPRSGPRLSRIAQSLGVSVATVSNALSGKGRVSAELSARIKKTAEEMGYVPSQAGRALRTGRTGVIGLVLADIANPLFPQIAQAIEFAASEAGYGVLIADSRGASSLQMEAIDRLLERGVDAMIVIPRRGTRIGALGCPVALIDSPSTPGNSVSADHWEAGLAMGQHLRELGHRKVLLLGSGSESNVQNDRLGGIRAALGKEAVCETLWIAHRKPRNGEDFSLGLAGYYARGFTAFATTSDLHALRALSELQRAGISIPSQASVTGFDDLALAEVTSPRLTTMRMDMPRIAELAVKALIERLDLQDVGERMPSSSPVEAAQAKVAMQLVVRDSTAPVTRSLPYQAIQENPAGELRP